MAGLLLIAIWLGCVYLVLKGVSILQIGLASGNSNRGLLMLIGIGSLVVAIVAALFFARVAGDQALLLSMIGNR